MVKFMMEKPTMAQVVMVKINYVKLIIMAKPIIVKLTMVKLIMVNSNVN